MNTVVLLGYIREQEATYYELSKDNLKNSTRYATSLQLVILVS